jgi:hypothetical protein
MEYKLPLHLIYLPEDVLLTISVHLNVTDILSLKQVNSRINQRWNLLTTLIHADMSCPTRLWMFRPSVALNLATI